MNWFLMAMKKSFDFKGRARRAEFAWFTLIYFLVIAALHILEAFAQVLKQENFTSILTAAILTFSLVTFCAGLSVTARRLHDLGYSGTLQLVILIPSILFGMADKQIEQAYAAGNYLPTIIAVLFLIIAVIWNIWLIFKDGSPEPNKYGESLKYPSTATENDSTDLVA